MLKFDPRTGRYIQKRGKRFIGRKTPWQHTNHHEQSGGHETKQRPDGTIHLLGPSIDSSESVTIAACGAPPSPRPHRVANTRLAAFPKNPNSDAKGKPLQNVLSTPPAQPCKPERQILNSTQTKELLLNNLQTNHRSKVAVTKPSSALTARLTVTRASEPQL